MIKKSEEQAIDIIAFLVTQYRKAFNHDMEMHAIEKARAEYCRWLKIDCDLSEDELHYIYLHGKIKADEMQLERHKKEAKELGGKR